jgi:bifunctional DNA-binding transcriptional regulator/antitoxin component of YhaV-PrlF toxin-antitoxin module
MSARYKVAVQKIIPGRVDQTAHKVVARKLVRLRERNQITLPSEIISGLAVEAGGFLEITRTSTGLILLKPTALVTVGSPEAELEETRAAEDIVQGRYKTFNSATDLMADIKNRRALKKKIVEKVTESAS